MGEAERGGTGVASEGLGAIGLGLVRVKAPSPSSGESSGLRP
jgi:hypothetical protein